MTTDKVQLTITTAPSITVDAKSGLAGPAGAAGATGPAGPAGSNGTNGTNGAAATINVGTTTTLPAGSSATVTNVGSSSAAVFNFALPQGATGPQGPTGAGGTIGFYAAFSDYTDQTVQANVGQAMHFSTVDESSGISLVSGTQMRFLNLGTYNIQWSGQFDNSSNQDQDVYVWVKKNGSDVAGSTGIVSVPSSHGGVSGHIIAGWNFVFSVAANDYLELWWSATSSAVSLQTYASGTSPTRPSTASLIWTAQQVMYTQVGPTGPTGSAATISVGSVNTGAAGSSATVTNSGTSGAAVLNFSIPRGDTGLTGPQGLQGPSGQWDTAQIINAQTASYAIATSDAGKLVTINSATTANVTIPAGLSLSAGQRIDIVQLGAGQVSIVASGTTVSATPGLKFRAQYSAVTIICLASNTYVAVGDLSV